MSFVQSLFLIANGLRLVAVLLDTSHAPEYSLSMKKHLCIVLALAVFLQACTMPGLFSAAPTSTPTASPTATHTPQPSATATSTPTPLPTFTPTPAPEIRVASADHDLFNGDYDGAMSEYTAALTNSSDPIVQAAAILGQGRTHYLSGVYPNALNELRTVIDRFPRYNPGS